MAKGLEKVISFCLLGSCFLASAGEPVTIELPAEVEQEASEKWSFCDAFVGLKTPIYKNPENPFIQQFALTGRMHYQYGHVEGSSFGDDFDGGGGELRRLWGGVKFKAFNRFDVLATGRFSRQGFDNNQIEFREIDFLSADFRLGDIGLLKNAKLGYGRYRQDFGRTWHISVNKIKTPERAPLFDRFIEPRATSVRFQADVGEVGWFMVNYVSSDASQWLSRWNGGGAAHFASRWNILGGQVFADGYVVEAKAEDDELFNYEKAFSLAYEWKGADWTMFVNGVWGDLGDDHLWGVVGMAHRMIYQDKVEAVFRYQYSEASGDVIRIGDRAARGVAGQEGVSRTLGDQEQNAYVGLNFYGCGLASKADSMFLLGLEWDKVTGSNQDFESYTLWASYRLFF